MKLSDWFLPKFKEIIDEIEPWLEAQPPRQWNQFVIYVTDTTPEYERGETDQRTHARIMRKSEAIAYECSAEKRTGSKASSELAKKFRTSQKANKVWIVASSADNDVQAVECEVHALANGGAS